MRAPDRWRRAEAVFEEAVEAPPEERSGLLDRLCGDDPELRQDVEALLLADQQAGDFLESPALPSMEPPSPGQQGRRLGAYRIERKIGEGGMGTVYLAVRADQEYEQRVAVKVFGYSPHRADLLRRFPAERQILASLEHPGIARLLDGGTTEGGLPYLVMEYIDGLPIDRYCEENRLTVEQRIDLFLEVCAAVAYAHQNLVVHRDLKPSNILVTAAGAPRLLDFGIAKLLQEGAARSSQTTVVGQRLMTPHFASPEQIAGRPITTASDVYALGVLLHLLLTGSLPYRFDPERIGAVEQAVMEQEPRRPSLSARDAAIARELAGDLDNVLLLALAKDPGKRYGSVELFAQDLRRYQQGLPVSARAATAGYRLRKFVARHRLSVGLSTTAAALIAGLAVTMTYQAVNLARQRDEIRRERDKAVQVTQFLKDMLQSPDPSQARGETVTARELLDQGAARIRSRLSSQPETRADLLGTMGTVYHNLGLDDRAQPLLSEALSLRRKQSGEWNPEVAESLEALGQYHLDRGELAEAGSCYRQALEIRQGQPDDPALARTLQGMARVLIEQARYGEAEPLLNQALALDRTHFGDGQAETADALASLGALREEQGDLATAEALYRQALGILRRQRGGEDPSTLNLLDNLGEVLVKSKRFEEAEGFYEESLQAARKIYGEEHVKVAERLNNLAYLYTDWGRSAQAEQPCREALAMLRRLLGNDNPKVAISLNNLAQSLQEQGDLAGAQPLLEEAVRIQARTVGEKHPDYAAALGNLANLLAFRHEFAKAETLARQTLDIRREALGETHAEVATAYLNLGAIIYSYSEPARAEPLLRQALRVFRKSLAKDDWRAAATESFLGECLLDQGKLGEAEPLLLAGYEELARKRGSGGPETAQALHRLVVLYEKRGDARKAALYRARLPA